jgi:chaperonin cofactor prefoldin
LETKIPLAVISVILIASLVLNAYFYTQNGSAPDNSLLTQVTDLQSQLANLQEQITNLESGNANLTVQVANLESQTANLRNQTSNLQSQNVNLQNKKSELQTQLNQLDQGIVAPKIVTRLGARDMRYNYSGQNLRLYISGEVWNVGTETAQNCSLHVTLYQGGTVSKDTYIELGTINGGSHTDVARNIYYAGEALTKWTITPEYSW